MADSTTDEEPWMIGMPVLAENAYLPEGQQ